MQLSVITFLSSVKGRRPHGHGNFTLSGETIRTYQDLIDLMKELALVTDSEFKELQSISKSQPAQAESAKNKSLMCRELLYSLCHSSVIGKEPPRDSLESFNSLLSAAASQGLTWQSGSYAKVFLHKHETFLPFLPLLIRELYDLLTSPLHLKLKICASTDCGTIFIDYSKNNSKRWCDMSGCGNRAKAKRFRETKNKS